MSDDEVIIRMDYATLDQITELAGLNFAPSGIAVKLDIPKKDFLRVWRNPKSLVREAYDKGIIEIEIAKRDQLKKKINTGSITAIQQHDKIATRLRFDNVKREVFGIDD